MPKPSPELVNPGSYPTSVSIPTRYADLDPNNHINNVAMAAIFETARSGFLRRSIASADELAGVRVVAIYIDYLAEGFHPGTLDVALGILTVGRTSWTVAQLAVQDGRPCALCRATLTRVGADNRPTPLPDEWRERFEPFRLKHSHV